MIETTASENPQKTGINTSNNRGTFFTPRALRHALGELSQLALGRAVAIGEETVVADTLEARREDVLEEAMQELHGLELHGLSAL